MTKTIKADRGWGKVRDPDTGEDVTVSEPTDVPDAQAQRLADEYRGVVIVSEDADEGEAAAEESADVETFRCGVEKSNGEPCEREVDSESATCWQHSPSDDE